MDDFEIHCGNPSLISNCINTSSGNANYNACKIQGVPVSSSTSSLVNNNIMVCTEKSPRF